METIKIYTVIPYYDNGYDVFYNNVKSFTYREDAVRYAEFTHHNSYFDIVESEMEININVY